MMKHIVLALGIAAVSTSAFAQDFSSFDGNQDGLVTFEELKAAGASLTEETFTAADSNQDNALDPAEFSALVQ